MMKFFKKLNKKNEKVITNSRDAAKERLHLVLMQDRANVSADFLEMMKQEIIEVIKKYIDVDEAAIDVRLTNKENEDGTNGAPALYANIPIVSLKDETKKVNIERKKEEKSNKSIEEKTTETEKQEDVGDKSVENTKKQEQISTDENTENEVETNNSKTTKNDEEKIETENVEKEKVEDVETKSVENTEEQDQISPDENIEPKEEVKDIQKTETSEKTEVE